LPYKNISIILDEIEIYYHPDMQRELTSNILSALENIKEKGEVGIESIHIIYLTHSPFILSDIPSSNILRLNNGKVEIVDIQTFGANIHDLLANDFFLKKGFMGEFSQNEINNVIDSLNYKRLSNLREEKQKLINSTLEKDEIEILKQEIFKIETKLENDVTPSEKYNETYCKRLIELVGEPMLYMSLMELYSQTFKESKNEFIDNQIKKLIQLRNDSNS
jgi:predicted ATP-binding protein involved in virulence